MPRDVNQLIDVMQFNFNYDKAAVPENFSPALLQTPGDLLNALHGQSKKQLREYFHDLNESTIIHYLIDFEFSYAFMHELQNQFDKLTTAAEKMALYDHWRDCIKTHSFPKSAPNALKPSWETYQKSPDSRKVEIVRFIQGQIDIEQNALQTASSKKSKAFFNSLIETLADQIKVSSFNNLLNSELCHFTWTGSVLTAFNAEKSNLLLIFKSLSTFNPLPPEEQILKKIFTELLQHFATKISASETQEYTESDWKIFCHQTVKQYAQEKIKEAKRQNEKNAFANRGIDWAAITNAFDDSPDVETLKLMALEEIHSNTGRTPISEFLKNQLIFKEICNRNLSLTHCIEILNYKPKENHALYGASDPLDGFKRFLSDEKITRYLPDFFSQFVTLFLKGESLAGMLNVLSLCEAIKVDIKQTKIDSETQKALIQNLTQNLQDGLIYLAAQDLSTGISEKFLKFILKHEIKTINDIFVYLSKNEEGDELQYIKDLLRKLITTSSDPENPAKHKNTVLQCIFMAAMRNHNADFITPYLVKFHYFLTEINHEGKSGLRKIIEENFSLTFLKKCGADLTKTSKKTGHNLLHASILLKRPDKLREVLVELPMLDPREKSNAGISPLFHALSMQDNASLAILLGDTRVKGKINAASSFYKLTPLAVAAMQGNATAITLLLKHGAKADSSASVTSLLPIDAVLENQSLGNTKIPIIHIVSTQNMSIFSAFSENTTDMAILSQQLCMHKKPIHYALDTKRYDTANALLKYEPTNPQNIDEASLASLLKHVILGSDLFFTRAFLSHPGYRQKMHSDLPESPLVNAVKKLLPTNINFHFIKALILLDKIQKQRTHYESNASGYNVFTIAFSNRSDKMSIASRATFALEKWIEKCIEQQKGRNSDNTPLIQALDALITNAITENQRISFMRGEGNLGAILKLFEETEVTPAYSFQNRP